MNPLGNGSMNGLSPQIVQSIQQVKKMMGIFQGNPMAMIQQNPMIGQIMQMSKGKNLEELFYSICQQQGINANEFLNELRR